MKIGTVTVVNKKTFRGRYEYIGRGSVFGNPYPLPQYTREASIAAFKKIFDDSMEHDTAIRRGVMALVDRVMKGEHIYLACYCKPLACHGDVICARIFHEVNKRIDAQIEKKLFDEHPEWDHRAMAND